MLILGKGRTEHVRKRWPILAGAALFFAADMYVWNRAVFFAGFLFFLRGSQIGLNRIDSVLSLGIIALGTGGLLGAAVTLLVIYMGTIYKGVSKDS